MGEEPAGERDAPDAPPSDGDERAMEDGGEPQDSSVEAADPTPLDGDDATADADETDGGDDEDATGDDAEGGLRKLDDDGPDESPTDADPPASRTRSGSGDPEVEEQWQEFYSKSPATPDSDEEVGGLAPGGVPIPDPDSEDGEDDDGDEDADEDGPGSEWDDFDPTDRDDADEGKAANEIGDSELADEIAENGPMETDLERGELSTSNPTPESDPGAEAAPTPTPNPEPAGGTWDEPAHPPDDEEMPLADHIEEMIKRFGFVVIFGAVVTALAYPFSEDVVLIIWDSLFPAAEAEDPYLYGPLEKITTQIKVASLLGILTALPMLVYQSYRFMRPGLYPQERRYYLAAVPTSLVFAAAGMAFSYFVVLPALFLYFLYYTADTAVVAFGLQKTFDLIVTLTGFLAVIFQIPLFIMLAIMLGVTTRRWLADKRLYFWGGFVLVAGLFAPDPTGMAPIIVAITEVVLFEGTLLLLKWVDRD